MPSLDITVVGLPGTGKTTFLAALWEVVSHDETSEALKLVSMPDERAYLQQIHEDWLKCKIAPRTRERDHAGAVNQIHEVRLELAQEDQHFTLSVPDLAGEAFDMLWERRTWSAGLADTAERSNGLLLFLSPNNIRYPAQIARLRGNSVDHDTGSGEAARASTEGWKPENAPTAPKVVDLLMQVSAANSLRQIFPMVIIISAWDLVRPDEIDPTTWIEHHLPLLSQFLEGNQEQYPSRAFGVSAQGGDFNNPSEVQRLRSELSSQRVFVQEATTIHRDITSPLRWLLGATLA